MSAFTIKKATRQGFKLLFGIYSESGNGKTYSALVLARGIVGPKGRIGLIDTESGRGSQYAPVEGEPPLPMGDYETVELGTPFTPARFIEAIEVLEKSGVDIGIIDSVSHVWNGIGGVIDMAMEIEEKTGKKGLHCWNKPKIEYQWFIQKLMHSKIPFICCLRSKAKSRQEKDGDGKTVIRKDEFQTPVSSEDFINEMTCYGELTKGNKFREVKDVMESLRECLPDNAPLTVGHGRKLAAWCAAPKGPGTATPQSKPVESQSTKALQKKLWDLTVDKHEGDPIRLDQWLWDEALMDTEEQRKTLSDSRLQTIIKKAELKLQEVGNVP